MFISAGPPLLLSRTDAQNGLYSIFKRLRLIKLTDLITLLITMFMYKFHNSLLPLSFNDYFTPVHQLHSYNTRLASGLCLSSGQILVFNIRYRGVKVWNALGDFDKRLSFTQLKRKLKANFIDSY